MSRALGLNIAKLLSSKVAAQGVMLLTTPFITRLFLPEHFGVMQIFESLATPLFIIACLKYEQAIPLGKTSQEVNASVVLSLFFTILVSGGSLLGVFFLRFRFAAWFHIPALAHFLWLLPLFVFIFGLHSTLNYQASHEGRFGLMAFAALGETCGDKLFVILWGALCGASAAGLLMGRFIGLVTNVLVLLRRSGRQLLLLITQDRPDMEVVRDVARRHKKFPLFSTWASLLNVMSFQLPALFFGLYFSSTIVGYYALAHRIVSLLSIFLGMVVAQVFFPTAAKAAHDLRLFAPLVQETFHRLVQLSLFPSFVLGVFGTTLFSLIFGQQWAESGMYAQLLSSWHFLIFLNLSLDIFALVNRQDLALTLTLAGILVRLGGLFASRSLNSPRFTLGLFVVFSVLFLLGQLLWKFRLAGVSVAWTIHLLLRYAFLSFILLFPAKWLSLHLHDLRVEICVIICATGGYIIALLLVDPSLRRILRTLMGTETPPCPPSRGE